MNSVNYLEIEPTSTITAQLKNSVSHTQASYNTSFMIEEAMHDKCIFCLFFKKRKPSKVENKYTSERSTA